MMPAAFGAVQWMNAGLISCVVTTLHLSRPLMNQAGIPQGDAAVRAKGLFDPVRVARRPALRFAPMLRSSDTVLYFAIGKKF
jgi:hypothetical protein